MGRRSFLKTAFVFSSTLTLSMGVTALPSFAQAQVDETSPVEVIEPAVEILAKTPAELPVAGVLPEQVLPLSTDTQTAVVETSAMETSVVETVVAETVVAETPDSPPAAHSEIPDLSAFSVETSDSETSDAETPVAETADESSEQAMTELAEALNADMAEIQSITAEMPEAATATLAAETTKIAIAAPPNPGASALSGLTSVGTANSTLLAGTAPNPAALNDLANRSLSASSLSASSLSASSLSASSLSANSSPENLLANQLTEIAADSVPALRAALNSDNRLTQLYAADALWTLTGDSESVLPTLISAATSGNLHTRELATLGLAYLGRQALPAIPFLNQLLGDSDSDVRNLAQSALEIAGSDNRPATTLGILNQATRHRQGIIPTALSVINFLWR